MNEEAVTRTDDAAWTRGRDGTAAGVTNSPPAGRPSILFAPLASLLTHSRFVAALAVLGVFVAAALLIVYGVLEVAVVLWDTLAVHHLSIDGAKELAVACIELTDLFLLGTVLYIVALGLYGLFVDPTLRRPTWLRIADLDDLKTKLVGVIIVLLGVTFLGDVVQFGGGIDVFWEGAGIALVIAALGLVALGGIGHHPHAGDG